MGRSQETFQKKEVRKKKEKKRKEKEQKRLAKKEKEKSSGLDDMIAYVDEKGMITSTPPDPDKRTDIEAEGIEVSIPKRGPDEHAGSIRQGKVTFFDDSKGYGFIKDSETQENVFVHMKDADQPIKEGDLVSFEKVKGRKGPSAIHVKILKDV